MNHDWKMEVYWRLPVVLQEAALSAYAGYLDRLYYGPGYEESLERFTRLQLESAPAMAAWQNERLHSIIRIAATRVPYYREQWRSLDWRSVKSAADLAVLPRLDKQALRQNEQRFLVEDLDPSALWTEKTSGTTGTALRIYWPKSMLPQWWALVEVAIRQVAHVGQSVPRAMLGGRTIVPGNTRKPPFWRFNRRWRQLYLSGYHVSKGAAGAYVKALHRYGSEWITGYGSGIAALAQFALEEGIAPLPMRAVIVSGDTLLPGMRRSIEQFFACQCYDSYGQCEGVSMAMECRRGRLHLIGAAGIWEILRPDGSPCAPGEVGEIVSTGLLNDAMPLIRYRTGDYAAWAPDQRCSCGNQQPIITHLEGRLDDYLITISGKKIGRLSTAVKKSPTIHSAQIVQDRAGHAWLLVRPGVGYRSADGTSVQKDILQRIGDFD
ncbi:MAG TPA: hypothetical protein VE131_00140, partial [Terriglobales bacterium]|nr:hypothetical protein [Terriglobales bacterium]